jgi:hypothetical protein
MSEAVAARSPGASGAARGRRTAISVALHLGVLALVVWVLLRPQIGSRQEALALLATVKVPWLLGAVAAEVASRRGIHRPDVSPARAVDPAPLWRCRAGRLRGDRVGQVPP